MPATSVRTILLRLLVIMLFGVMGAVIATSGAFAQGDAPQVTAEPGGDAPATDEQPAAATAEVEGMPGVTGGTAELQLPQACSECHLDVVNAWEGGAHAGAYADPTFQAAWETQNQDPMCLQCHTTGFELRTGQYAHEGVTCEACHGLTPVNHPPEPLVVDPGLEVCAECHTTTYVEWQLSAHGEQQLACTTCHNPHPQTLRFDHANDLCLNCHNEEARDDFAHLVHVEQNCTDCHWFRPSEEDLLAHYVSGNLFPTGHTAEVQTQACVVCHGELVETGSGPGEITQGQLNLPSSHPLLEAQVRIRELEAEVRTVRAQGENDSVLRLIQGLILGVAVGALVVAAVSRFRRYRTTTVDVQEE